jgi:uncharacterized phage protein gp47/JayE
MADETVELTPLYPGEDEAAIFARWVAWANEGLDPALNADEWVDTREGSHWHRHVMPGVREFAKVYDLLGTEVVAAGIPVWSWGTYLDDHAEVQSLVRLAATPAAGEVLFTGAPGTPIGFGTLGALAGVTPSSPDDDAPTYVTTTAGVIGGGGTVLLPVVATVAGVAGNIGANAISYTDVPGVVASNPAPIEGGTEVETDEALRARVIATYAGQGAGRVLDYVRWAGAWAGVGRVTVIPLWNGPGTVKVVLLTAAGDPVSPAVVAEVQNDLDPVAGQGRGRAPVSAVVTVETAVALDIAVVAELVLEQGFSLDGSAGTVAVGPDVTDALRQYVEGVQSGGEVVFEHVKGAMITLPGVHDLGVVTVNGGTANVPVSGDPAESPNLLAPALSVI